MTIRSRLLGLSVLVAAGIAAVAGLFASAVLQIDTIDRERSRLSALADAVRNLSITVNSLDSNQYEGVSKRFTAAREHAEATFDDVARITVLPSLNAELKEAFEIIGNMHALVTEDVKTLGDQFAAFQPDLEKVFLESRSTSLRMFYTVDHARQDNLSEVYVRLEELVTSINGMTETLSGVSDTIQAQSDVIDQQTAHIRESGLVTASGSAAAVLFAVVGLVLLLGNSVSRRVKTMALGLDPVSQGDFSQHLDVRGSDEIARMTGTVNGLLDALNRLLREVQEQVMLLETLGEGLTEKMSESTSAVDQIQRRVTNSRAAMVAQTEAVSITVDSARRLESLTEHLAEAFRRQADILGSSSSGIEQIIANIRSVNSNTAQAEQSSRVLFDVAREGQGAIALVSRSVDEIAKSTSNLVNVGSLINDIADQTNLLAMNASIEAAHAGQSGLGFGVVAHEIRKLAEQAASQARTIAEDLTAVDAHVASIRGAVDKAVAVFQSVTNQTELVGAIVHQLQTAMEEQSRGGELVLEGLRQLNSISEQVGQAVGEMKNGEAEILERVKRLEAQTAELDDNNRSVEQHAVEIGAIMRETDALAQSTGGQIATIKRETSRFKTSA